MRYTDWLEEDDIAIDKMIRAHEKQMGQKQEQKKPVFAAKSVREMTDEEVFARANRDRKEGLGRYAMTLAMEEEQRRLSKKRDWPINSIFDE